MDFPTIKLSAFDVNTDGTILNNSATDGTATVRKYSGYCQW